MEPISFVTHYIKSYNIYSISQTDYRECDLMFYNIALCNTKYYYKIQMNPSAFHNFKTTYEHSWYTVFATVAVSANAANCNIIL